MTKKIFWTDGFTGETYSVYPLRNDLKKFIERIPDTEEVVGIVYDGSFNLEILTAEKPMQVNGLDVDYPKYEEDN